MGFMPTTTRVICGVALLCAMGWTHEAQAQFGAGSKWLRTDAQGKGITLTIEACCNGGLRLVYLIPSVANQPAVTLTVDAPLNGTEVPTLVGGKPSGQTMAITRLDDRHYRAVVKVNGKPFGTSNGTVSPDGTTMIVESAFEGGGTVRIVVEDDLVRVVVDA